MRIANRMVMDTVLRNLSLSSTKYMCPQNMMSAGKRLNKPSDSPIGVTQDLGYCLCLSNFENYKIKHSKRGRK